jgi:hypothetical protein
MVARQTGLVGGSAFRRRIAAVAKGVAVDLMIRVWEMISGEPEAFVDSTTADSASVRDLAGVDGTPGDATDHRGRVAGVDPVRTRDGVTGRVCGGHLVRVMASGVAAAAAADQGAVWASQAAGFDQGAASPNPNSLPSGSQ